MYTSYHPNGKVREQGEYAADRKHREWKMFDEEGNLINTVIYRGGVVVPAK